MDPQPRRLGRVGLILWLLAPLVVVGVLYLMTDRSRGKPEPNRIHRPEPAEQAGR
ncbi:MAG: hypothetical protein KF745_06005 [Phycisphaeraceae bacterium]|nr:hypothetical protein [Phycisphaeraceae bacterium]